MSKHNSDFSVSGTSWGAIPFGGVYSEASHTLASTLMLMSL